MREEERGVNGGEYKVSFWKGLGETSSQQLYLIHIPPWREGELMDSVCRTK